MLPVGGTRESRDPPSHGGACGGNRLTKSPLLAPQIRRCDAYHCPSSHSLASEYSLASHRQSQREENIASTSSTIQDLRETFPYGPFHGYNSVYEGQGLQDDTLSTFATKESLSEASSLVIYTATLLNVLSLLQQKIQQLQAFVQLMAQGCGGPIAQQQAIAAGITSVISQLVAVIADMLQPSVEPTPQMMAPEHQLKRFSGEINGLGFNISPKSGPGNYFGVSIESSLGTSYGSSVEGTTVLGDGLALGGAISMSGSTGIGISRRQNFGGQGTGSAHCTSQDLFSPGLAYGINNLLDMNVRPNGNLATWNSEDSAGPLTAMEQYLHGSFEEHDSVIGMRDDDDDGEGENLSPGSYELVEMDAVEILAEHTHFCKICGKGFKRDANLRMHMRGHGDEYKTPAALARPDNSSSQMSLINVRRYSCPYVGCKRNKKHCKFQPLKTMLCVKNHYRRSHCPKELTCSKCKTKKFSVVADLKTHEKHCGRDKWQCSCGTTFSRKDKLFGHIGLFAGHTPALLPLHPLQEMDIPGTVGVSLCNGSGGFTTSNVSVPSLSSNEPAYPAGSGNIHFNHRNRLFIGTPIVAGSDPIVEVSNGYKICAEVATICQNGKLQNFGRVSGSFSPTDVNNTVMLRDSSHSPTDLASSPVYQEPHPNNLLQQVNGNTQGSPGAIQHSSGG